MKQGLLSFLKAISVLKSNKRLWFYALAPGAVGLGIFSWSFIVIFNWIADVIHSILSKVEGLGSVGGVLANILGFVLWPFSLLFAVFVLYNLTKILIAPLYSFLSEEVFLIRRPRIHAVTGIGWVRRTFRMLRISFVKSAIFVIVGLFLFILSFVPILQFLSPVALVLIAAFDIADFAMEAAELDLATRFKLFFRRWPLFFGFSFGVGLVLFIPVLNMVLLPIAIAAGSIVVDEALNDLKLDTNVKR